MRISSALARKAVVAGCLVSGALPTLACGDGPAVPTSPAPAAFSSSASSSPIQRLFLTKTCDPNFPSVPVCTVVTAPHGPLPVDTTAAYDVLVFDKIMSGNVLLTTPDGTAAGHCTLSFKTGQGTCAFARGTGDLTGFHANVKVLFDFATGVTTWDGTYHFSGRD